MKLVNGRPPIVGAGGTTLIELVMTIVIISVAIAGVVGAFSLVAGRSSDPLIYTRAVALSEMYMDEILTKKFDDGTGPGGNPKYTGGCNIGPEAGEVRSDYDDVDDYHGVDDSPPSNAQGPLSGYRGFSVQVTITCAGDELGIAASEGKRADLAITTPDGQTFDFSSYRVNF